MIIFDSTVLLISLAVLISYIISKNWDLLREVFGLDHDNLEDKYEEMQIFPRL